MEVKATAMLSMREPRNREPGRDPPSTLLAAPRLKFLKANRFRNELVRVVEVAGILTMLPQSDPHRVERSVVDDREASALQIG